MSSQLKRRIKIITANIRKRFLRFWKQFKYLPKFISILIIAVIGTLIVYWIYKNESHKEEILFAMKLENAAKDRTNAIQDNISKSIELMYVQGQALQQLLTLKNAQTNNPLQLDIDTFFAITQEAVIHNPHPSFDAIHWVPKVAKKDLNKFLEQAQAIYAAEGTEFNLITIDDNNSDYLYPILYSQTISGDDNLGVDLYSKAAFRKYMDIAKEVGVATASTKIETIENNNYSVGFLIFLPIYTKPYKKLDILEHDSELLGYLVERITLSNLINQSLINQEQSRINFVIYDSLVENYSDVLFNYVSAKPSESHEEAPDKAPEVIPLNTDDKSAESSELTAESAGQSDKPTKFQDPLLTRVYQLFGALIAPLVKVHAEELAKKLKSTTNIDVGGFKWRLEFQLDPEQIIEDSSPVKWLLMLTVALVTLLLCGYLLFLIIHTVQVEKEVRIRTNKLLTAKRNLELYSIELQELSEKLARLANHDPLTGLLNRRAFEHILKEELYRAQRYNFPVSVLLLDIDYFKKVNDNFGHQVGDLLLTECAEKFKSRIRESDYVCRFGGEEFIFLLPHTNIEGAWNVAENIRKSIEDYDFSCIGLNRKVTVSIGLATSTPNFPLDDHNLILYADKGVYMSKERGRNQVNCFQLTSLSEPDSHAAKIKTSDLASNVG